MASRPILAVDVDGVVSLWPAVVDMVRGENALLGQLVPTGAGTIEVQTRAGVIGTVAVDEVGCFPISPIPPSPFRLRCRTTDGASVVTGWITL